MHESSTRHSLTYGSYHSGDDEQSSCSKPSDGGYRTSPFAPEKPAACHRRYDRRAWAIDRVHGLTTGDRALPIQRSAACLAKLDVGGSELPTTNGRARQRVHVADSGRHTQLSVGAILATSCTAAPAERAILAATQRAGSIACTTVPVGMLRSGLLRRYRLERRSDDVALLDAFRAMM